MPCTDLEIQPLGAKNQEGTPGASAGYIGMLAKPHATYGFLHFQRASSGPGSTGAVCPCSPPQAAADSCASQHYLNHVQRKPHVVLQDELASIQQ